MRPERLLSREIARRHRVFETLEIKPFQDEVNQVTGSVRRGPRKHERAPVTAQHALARLCLPPRSAWYLSRSTTSRATQANLTVWKAGESAYQTQTGELPKLGPKAF